MAAASSKSNAATSFIKEPGESRVFGEVARMGDVCVGAAIVAMPADTDPGVALDGLAIKSDGDPAISGYDSLRSLIGEIRKKNEPGMSLSESAELVESTLPRATRGKPCPSFSTSVPL